MNNIASVQETEWANSYLFSVCKEIQDSNGKIKEVMNTDNIIRIVSKISNYIRHDIISKNEVITYKGPSGLNLEIENMFQ